MNVRQEDASEPDVAPRDERVHAEDRCQDPLAGPGGVGAEDARNVEPLPQDQDRDQGVAPLGRVLALPPPTAARPAPAVPIFDDGRDRAAVARAWRLAPVLGWIASLPGVRVSRHLARNVLDTVDPSGAEARAVRDAYPTPPFAADFKKRIRATLGLRLRAWVESWACACQWAELRRKPAPTLAAIAHGMKLPTSDLTQLAGSCSDDEMAFLYLTVPIVMLKSYGFGEPTPKIARRRDDLYRLLREARQKVGRATTYLPWDDPETARLIEEQKR